MEEGGDSVSGSVGENGSGVVGERWMRQWGMQQRRTRVEQENEEGCSCSGGDDTLTKVVRVGQEEEEGGNGGCSGKVG